VESILDTISHDIPSSEPATSSGRVERVGKPEPSQLRRIVRLVGPWLVAGLLLYLVADQIAGTSGPPPGEPAPALAVTLSSGEPFTLAAHQGEVVVLNFWATWCPACRVEGPQLSLAGRELSGRGVSLVGLSVDRMPLPSVVRLARQLGMDYPIAMADSELARSFSVEALPTTIVVGKDGKVAQTFVGGIDASQLGRAVNRALSAD